MFKMKAAKGGMRLIRGSLKQGGNMLSDRISNSMKYTARWTRNIGRNPGVTMLRNRIQRRPAGSLIAIAGIGMMIFGFISLIRK